MIIYIQLFQHMTSFFSDFYHILRSNCYLNINGIIPYIIQSGQNGNFNESLSSETGVSVPRGSTQKRLILLARVGLDGVRDVTSGCWVLALVDQGEGHSMAEGPHQKWVIFAAAQTDEE